MSEPVSLKLITDAITSFWGRSAILLWCLATICLFLWFALLIGVRIQYSNSSALFATYGTYLPLSSIALFVLAAFKAYSERPEPILSFIPNEQQSLWGQSKQPSGQINTSFCLRFQATNLSDHSVMLSEISLLRPFVRRRHILTKLLMTKHHSANTYSPQNPIDPHSLTYAEAHFVVDHPVGCAGKPLRVTMQVQDHVGRWHKLVFPYVRTHQETKSN